MQSFMMDWQEAFTKRNVHLASAHDSHANRGMNKIANDFLETDCDVWINIDADIRFRRVDIDRLLEHAERGVPLVYGIYPKKEDITNACLCTLTSDLPQPDPVTGLVEVRRSGRGFMLVKREVLERMKEDNGGPALRYHNHDKVEWDFFVSGCVTGEFSALDGQDKDEDGYPTREWISEDWYFCERARKLGYHILTDSQIALGHIGHKEFRFSGAQVTRLDSNINDWHQIDGWFSDADAQTYKRIVESLPDNARVVEIGSWMGRSTGALVAACKEAGKNPEIHAVDTFKGTLNEGDVHYSVVKQFGGSVRKPFEDNMKALGAELNVIEADSVQAAGAFSDACCDAVFIDGDHAYTAVSSDISAWLPKVKPGGLIGGHDFDYPDVRRAVYEAFDWRDVETVGRCWLTYPRVRVTGNYSTTETSSIGVHQGATATCGV